MALSIQQYRILFAFWVLFLSIVIGLFINFWIVSTAAVLLILQLAVVVIALQCGTGIAYFSAIIEAIFFNFLFTIPIFSLQMLHASDIVNLLVFTLVAFTTTQLSERFRRQNHALKLEQLRNTILLSVSHDLRTPLVTIIGTLTTLQTYMDKLDAQEKTDLLDSAALESHRLHHYIENLLQATKIQHGTLNFNTSKVSMIEVVKQSIKRCESAKCSIKLTVQSELPELFLSPSLMEQALFNVLDNSLRYSPLNESVEVNLYLKNQELVIDIADKGMGLSKEKQRHIFDLFYTGGTSKVIDTNGSGLGLSVAKGIVLAHCGRIVAVNIKQGCLIRIFLPINMVN
jgi:K+-sensing histidine kinase KdpD